MRSTLLLLLLTGICHAAFNQSLVSKYVQLKAEQFEEEGKKYVGVWPAVVAPAGDTLGMKLLKYHRRFEYLLTNKTRFQSGYEELYPDTNAIRLKYADSIGRDPVFMKHFDVMVKPFTGKPFTPVTYSIKEVMKVASRFYYADGVRADSSITSHICITLNGIREADWATDYTGLEAFVFEAIFSPIDKGGRQPACTDRFKNYLVAGQNKFKGDYTSKEAYLKNVRDYAFEKMETDTELLRLLTDYHQNHYSTFSFLIK